MGADKSEKKKKAKNDKRACLNRHKEEYFCMNSTEKIVCLTNVQIRGNFSLAKSSIPSNYRPSTENWTPAVDSSNFRYL